MSDMDNGLSKPSLGAYDSENLTINVLDSTIKELCLTCPEKDNKKPSNKMIIMLCRIIYVPVKS